MSKGSIMALHFSKSMDIGTFTVRWEKKLQLWNVEHPINEWLLVIIRKPAELFKHSGSVGKFGLIHQCLDATTTAKDAMTGLGIVPICKNAGNFN